MLQKSVSGTAVAHQVQGDPADDELDVAHIVRTLWRGKWLIAFATFLFLAGGFYYAFISAIPHYTAASKVALESREEQVVDLESVVTGLSGDVAAINTEVEVIRSRVLAERVVAQLNLTEDPEFNKSLREDPGLTPGTVISALKGLLGGAEPEATQLTEREVMDQTIDALLEAVSVSNLRQTYVFQITAVTQDAEKSALIANTLADVYINDQLQVKFEATEQAAIWLSERVAELQQELEAAEKNVSDFNASADLVSPEALEALNRQVKDLRTRVEDAGQAAAEAEARLQVLKTGAEGGDRAAMAALANDRTLNRVLDLIENGADPTTFDERFSQITERAAQDAERSANQFATLERSLGELETRIKQQAEDLVILEQLQREAEANRLIYESFLARLKEITVQQGIQQADSRLLSPAIVPASASSPRVPIILAMSLILGVFAGSSTVLTREFMQSTYRTSEDLERVTGMTVLGQIPMIPGRRRRKIFEYLADKPSSPAAEAVRNLRTSVLLSDMDSPPQIIMVTSSVPGEGKTTQSISLAQNFAGLGKRVLLIEGDIRRRVFGEYFDLPGKTGWVSVVTGAAKFEDALQRADNLAVDILVGEQSSTNPADVFSSPQFEVFLKSLRDRYDIILIDTPPVLVVPDARVIGNVSDAILYAVHWDRTTRSQVAEGLRQLQQVNLRVTGLILSQINPRGMRRYGYGDRYGAYASYGKGYYDA